MISVLCAKKNSIYNTIPGIDVWDANRDAYFFTGSNPVITHSPCAQWSRMKGFANDNPDEKELSFFCLQKVIRNGGIFEHPAGSTFFKEAGISKNIYSVDQVWWGFPAKKKTYLFFHKCKPLPFPVMQHIPTHAVISARGNFPALPEMKKSQRATTFLPFAQYLINCINESH